MMAIYVLTGISFCLVLLTGHLCFWIREERKQLRAVVRVMDLMLEGDLDRRVLTKCRGPLAEVCYKTNEIAIKYKSRFGEMQQREAESKRIMTSLSHDVRTPLTTLIGYLEGTQDLVMTLEEKERYIDIAKERAYTLKAYIDSLFEWFKLQSSELPLNCAATDICEVTRDIMADWILQFEKNKLIYDFRIPEDEIMINIDASAYKRLLDNLIYNSLKHSGAEWIGVQVKAGDGWIKIQVGDNGRGICSEKLPYVFERLYKGDISRSDGGSGLGLAIARELARRQGGDITVESTPGQRTDFTIQFPTGE